jgi:methylated-DNA-[protein]-cysteine S-methyltransferase
MMAGQGFALFETAIGRCGVAWGERGIVGVQLPEASDARTRARLARRFPGLQEGTAPPLVRRAVEGMTALLRGEACDLRAVELDMDAVPAFHRTVYELARAVPPGSTLTYGALAARAGAPGSARAVGQAMGRNPFPIVVPCHRVVAAGGKTGGFSASGGVATKLRMLSIEGAPAQAALFDGDGRLGFDPAAAITHLRAADPKLGAVIDRIGPFGMVLKRAPSLFLALAEAIVYQQLHGRAAATIFGRVCALFPRSPQGPTPERLLRMSDERLRGAGLSRAKLLALRDLAERAARGEIPTLAEVGALDDEEIVARLTRVRGIGRWTVEMLLIFRLGRPDVLPADDYGVRKGFALAFRTRELPTRDQLARRAARWSPYRTVASWYLWRVAEAATVAAPDRRG